MYRCEPFNCRAKYFPIKIGSRDFVVYVLNIHRINYVEHKQPYIIFTIVNNNDLTKYITNG